MLLMPNGTPVALGKAGIPNARREELFEPSESERRLVKPYHRTSDFIYFNAEAVGRDWGVHSRRAR
jgi:hypothetical protein